MIRVMIVDDHAIVRDGLRRIIASDEAMEVVAVVADGSEAAAAAREHRPDVVLMDLSMPGLDGIEATRRVTADVPEARIVVLTSFSDQQRIVSALDAGAIGYLLKDADPDDLLRGIRSAAAGDSPLNPKAARMLLDAQRSPRREDPAGLSSREVEVLALVAKGLANKHIAIRLGISERTVKAHLTRVFRAIGVNDRTQAALWARDHLPGGKDQP